VKKLSVLLTALMTACLVPAAHADVVSISPFDRVTSTAYSAAPWLLVAAVAGLTLLILWKLRKKK